MADTCVFEISFSSIGSAPMRRLSARSLVSSMVPMSSICAPVRPSMPSGFWTKSIVASETIWLSSVIAKRWKVCSRVGPGGRMIFAPRSAIRLVTRAKASRPWSVNSIVTTGAFVFGSVCLLGVLDVGAGELRVVLEHEEALDPRGLVLAPRSASTTTMPCGHLDHPRARGRPAGAERLELLEALGLGAYSGAGPSSGS